MKEWAHFALLPQAWAQAQTGPHPLHRYRPDSSQLAQAQLVLLPPPLPWLLTQEALPLVLPHLPRHLAVSAWRLPRHQLALKRFPPTLLPASA